MTLLLKLILAHFLGDFLLQPKLWVKAKERNKIKAYQLYLHVAVHFILIMVLVWDVAFLPWAGLIAGSHLLIDSIKLYLQHPKHNRLLFFTDQFLHLLILVVIWYWHTPLLSGNFSLQTNSLLLWVTT